MHTGSLQIYGVASTQGEYPITQACADGRAEMEVGEGHAVDSGARDVLFGRPVGQELTGTERRAGNEDYIDRPACDEKPLATAGHEEFLDSPHRRAGDAVQTGQSDAEGLERHQRRHRSVHTVRPRSGSKNPNAKVKYSSGILGSLWPGFKQV